MTDAFDDAPEKTGKKGLLTGIVFALTGIAHFMKPDLFKGITATAFPRDTDKHLQINGSIETALGLGLMVPKTRKLATFGVLGYVAYLGANAARNR
ncbi:hypothetical protein [Mycolicibacterium sp. CBMA 234]|uniref:hypothetical protein n=1 Tax=Mycolicibacterium sp. CBMA 234 TaxID=1918495 RepID=UPI0028162E3B|nr:hypothetical protein [Mycolicibacterium sp. CBMA 234]